MNTVPQFMFIQNLRKWSYLETVFAGIILVKGWDEIMVRVDSKSSVKEDTEKAILSEDRIREWSDATTGQ